VPQFKMQTQFQSTEQYGFLSPGLPRQKSTASEAFSEVGKKMPVPSGHGRLIEVYYIELRSFSAIASVTICFEHGSDHAVIFICGCDGMALTVLIALILIKFIADD